MSCGAREAVIEGETGYIVPAGDDRLMAQRMIELLGRSETGARNGRARSGW